MKHLSYLLPVLLFIISSCHAQTEPKDNITVQEAKELIKSNKEIQILDVRTPGEVAAGTIQNAIVIDWYDANFDQKVKELDPTKPLIIYCKSGGRSAKASRRLKASGFQEVYNLLGGYGAWTKH